MNYTRKIKVPLEQNIGNSVSEGVVTGNGNWLIDVRPLPTGVYFAVIHSSLGSKTVRILVRH